MAGFSRRRALAVAAGMTLAVSLWLMPVASRADAFTDSALAFTKAMISDGLSSLTVKTIDRTQRIERLRAFMKRYADMEAISHFVLGRYWDRATPAQQTEFVKLFENYLIHAYVGGLEDYHAEQIKYLGASSEDPMTAVVRTRIDEPGAEPTRVDIVLTRNDKGSFHVSDLVVDGVSVAIAKKSEFAALLRQNAGSVDGLLSALRQKVENLEAHGG